MMCKNSPGLIGSGAELKSRWKPGEITPTADAAAKL
jgi:hypothetical protein